jgi:adenylate cyclase
VVEKYTRWLLDKSSNFKSALHFFAAHLDFLNTLGLDIFRSNFATRSLHPQYGAISLLWSNIDDIPLPIPTRNGGIRDVRKVRVGMGFVNQLRVPKVNLEGKGFLESPMAPVILHGKVIREKIGKESIQIKFPIIKDLIDLSASDYLALPVRFQGNIAGFLSYATKHKDGFTEETLAELEQVSNLFVIALEARIKEELLEVLLKLYLGETTGPLVLSGRIERGDMETFESVIWFSDIRGFTEISSSSESKEVINLLNSYYETIIPVLQRYGGEVLKFLGDGLLVIFNAPPNKSLQVKYRSILAAKAANQALDLLNEKRKTENKMPVRHGIGLHYGTIEYGNIGGRDRLDFTAIGSSVNMTSRVAALCGDLDKSLLLSEDLAKLLRIQLISHGKHTLKGIPQPQEIFSVV